MNLIPEKWKHLNDLEYLNLLLNPKFINVEGLIILKAHYNPKTFSENWLPIIKNNKDKLEKIENTINHVHFSNFTKDTTMQEMIGKKLSHIWSKTLRRDFPDTNFEMPLFYNSTEWELGFWVLRTK